MEALLQSPQEFILKPITIKNILLLSPGRWNDVDYTELEIQKAFNSTDWNDRKYTSLYLDHQDTKERGVGNWVGYIKNRTLQGSSLYGDLEIWNPMIGAYLSQAKAKFGVSATLAGRENKELGRMEDFHFESFSIVTDPACKPAMINLANKPTLMVQTSDVKVVTMENEVKENMVELETEELKMAMIRRKEAGEQVADGIKVEKEHKDTYDKLFCYFSENNKIPSLEEFARMIATDHVKEDKKYYDKLDAANLAEIGPSAGSEVRGSYGTEPAKWDKKKKKDELSSELKPSLVDVAVLTDKSEIDTSSRKENSDIQSLKGGIKMPEIIENTSVKVEELATPAKVVDALPKIEGPGIHDTNVNGHSIFIKQEGKNLAEKEDKAKDKKEKDDDKDEDDKEMSSDAILNKVKEMSADELVKFTEFTKAHLSANKEASAKEVYLAFEKSKKDKKSEKELSANDLLASIDSRIASLKELDSSKKIQEMETKIQELSAKVKTPDRKTLSVAFSNAKDSNLDMLSFLQHRIN